MFPALRVRLRGRSGRIFLKRNFPRVDGLVSGEAEPRPLLESLPAVPLPGRPAATTTSSVDVLVKKNMADGASTRLSDFTSEPERGSPGRAELVRLDRGDGGGLHVAELVAEDTDKEFEGGRLLSTSSTPPSFVVHDLHCRTSDPATSSSMSCERAVTSRPQATGSRCFPCCRCFSLPPGCHFSTVFTDFREQAKAVLLRCKLPVLLFCSRPSNSRRAYALFVI